VFSKIIAVSTGSVIDEAIAECAAPAEPGSTGIGTTLCGCGLPLYRTPAPPLVTVLL